MLTELVENREKNYLGLQEFATRHSISLRTVQTDLVFAKQLCERYGLSLETRYGKKAQLVGDDNSRRRLKQHLGNQKEMTEHSVLYRKKEILLKLLTTPEPYSIRRFAQDFYISPSSIAKDLKYIETELSDTSLSLLKDKSGTTIVGPRREKLKLAESIIYELIRCNTQSASFLETIQHLFPLVDIELLSKTIHGVEKEYDFSLNETTFLGLLVHLLHLFNGSIECQGSCKDMEIPVEVADFCDSLSQAIQSIFGKELVRKERDYLEQYLTCMGVNALSIKDVNAENLILNEEIEQFISQFLETLSETFVLPLKDDETLILRLRWHCYAMFERIEQSRQIENAFIDEIKENYPAVFSGVLFALQTASPKKYFQFSEEEIGFLVIYMQASIERNTKGRSAIIVCMEGLVFSELISVRLKKYLPSLHIEKTVSMQELLEMDLSTVDFVISTSPLTINKPVVVISPMVQEADIERITISMQETNLKYLAISEMVDKDLIFIQKHFSDKEQVLQFLCSELADQNIVSSHYYSSVMSREQKLSTELGNSFAIPHGEMAYVYQSKLAICTLVEPILWEKKRVDCIFLLAIHSETKKKNKEFFAEFYEFIQVPNNLEQLRKARTCQDVLETFVEK